MYQFITRRNSTVDTVNLDDFGLTPDDLKNIARVNSNEEVEKKIVDMDAYEKLVKEINIPFEQKKHYKVIEMETGLIVVNPSGKKKWLTGYEASELRRRIFEVGETPEEYYEKKDLPS